MITSIGASYRWEPVGRISDLLEDFLEKKFHFQPAVNVQEFGPVSYIDICEEAPYFTAVSASTKVSKIFFSFLCPRLNDSIWLNFRFKSSIQFLSLSTRLWQSFEMLSTVHVSVVMASYWLWAMLTVKFVYSEWITSSCWEHFLAIPMQPIGQYFYLIGNKLLPFPMIKLSGRIFSKMVWLLNLK